ncbi:hypothetical protein CRX72_08575 [Pantoea sp. BRM17]|nr:hypothetical protein CRX72_08575 [Pantoea sp. BRM17]
MLSIDVQADPRDRIAWQKSARPVLTGYWQPCRRVETQFDSFALDATHFVHQGKNWYLWAQKDPAIPGNSNLYLAELLNPWTLKGTPVMLGLREAPAVTVWRKPDQGEYSELIWAPELHHINGQWVIYFAAAPSREIKEGLFQHRMYALVCDDADPPR